MKMLEENVGQHPMTLVFQKTSWTRLPKFRYKNKTKPMELYQTQNLPQKESMVKKHPTK